MKTSFFFAFFLLVFNFLNAQSKDGINASDYEKSAKAFAEGQKKHNNSYQFSIFHASFTGYWNKTTFVVKNGKVVERHYASGHDYQKNKYKKSWKESGLSLGSHKDEGEAVKTMEDIYKEAAGWVAKADAPKSTNNETDGVPLLEINNNYYFDADKEGILSTAGFVPEGCMDDCFRGYHIRDFKWADK